MAGCRLAAKGGAMRPGVEKRISDGFSRNTDKVARSIPAGVRLRQSGSMGAGAISGPGLARGFPSPVSDVSVWTGRVSGVRILRVFPERFTDGCEPPGFPVFRDSPAAGY